MDFTNIENFKRFLWYNRNKITLNNIKTECNKKDNTLLEKRIFILRNRLRKYSSYNNIVKHKERNNNNMIKERVKNNAMELVNSNYNRAYKLVKTELKNHFGKTYKFPWNADNKNLFKFISKYNDKFKKAVSGDIYSNTLSDSRYYIKFDNHTFGILSTGIFTSYANIEESKIFEERHDRSDIELYIFGRYYKKYCRVLDKIIKYKSNKVIDIYNVNYKNEDLNITYTFTSNRSDSTLYFENNECKKICNHIDKFNNEREFYKSKELSYKTGILLYGEPGTGKSTLAKVLAGKYNRSIINISISDIENLDLNYISLLIKNEGADGEKFIILFEDIDTLFLNRQDEDTVDNRKVINKLLQFLDSNTSPDDVIFIATTNHKERLDEALLRDGRFDLKLEIKPLSKPDVIYSFAKSFGVNKHNVDNVLDVYSGNKYNQSYLQNVFLKLKEQEL